MGSMESMGCAEAKKQLFVKTAMFKVCTVLYWSTCYLKININNWVGDFSSGVKSYFYLYFKLIYFKNKSQKYVPFAKQFKYFLNQNSNY